ncbi:MAG: ATP-binding protein [Campylobacterota bacterium]|nr:ATP-binding protein [Campylobacterota bacterium]
MDGLKQVSLIKSAKFDFASVNVEGNSLFIGANGAGKTTLLRAILYFYTASSHGLGINSSKKISFSDYYFEYENSYIAYIYKKDEKYILVTVYKEGSVKFRFTLFDTFPNIKEIFIKENKPIGTADLWIKLKEIGSCSNIIPNGAKYKEVLYSKSHKEKMFSLFEAKGYESFTKTLSNIFINSKVDSEAIKKVIVSSLGIQSNIDLSQVHRNLSGFNKLYEDIRSYESNVVHIKKIIELLNEYEQTKGLLQDDLSTLCNSKEKTYNSLDSLDKLISNLQNEKGKISEKLQYEQNLYQKRKDKLYQTKGVLDDFIKNANGKKSFYEKENIKEKLVSYESLEIKQKELNNIYETKNFLTKEYENLQKEHELQIQKIENSFISLQNSLNSKISTLQNLQNQEIKLLKEEESKEIEGINEEFVLQSSQIKDKDAYISSKIQELNYLIESNKKGKFTFKDDKKIQEYQEEQRDISSQRKGLINSLNLLDKDMEKQNTIFEHKEQQLMQTYEKELKQLESSIENIKALLYPSKNSLIEKIYQKSDISQKYIHFLKDDILKSDLDVEFKDDTNSIFEIEPLDIDIAKSDLEKKLQDLKTNHIKLETRYIKDKKSLEKEQTNFESKIYKSKRKLNDEIKALDLKLITIQTKLTNLEEQKIKDEKQFKDDKSTKIDKLSCELESLEIQLKDIKNDQNNLHKQKEQNKKTKRSYYTKRIKKVQSEYTPKIESLKKEIQKEQLQQKQELKTQDELYHQLLEKNNVDTDELKKLENQIIKLEDSIKMIQGYQKIIFGYEKDKCEYIDKIDIKTKELQGNKKDIESLKIEFESITLKMKEDIEDLEKNLKVKQKEHNDKTYQLRRVEEFENATTFSECIKWDIKYIPNEAFDDIVTLINKIDIASSKYRGYYTKVENILGKLNSLFDNSLNITKQLDAIDTAYELKDYHESKRVENTKSLLSQNLNQILKSIIEQYDTLLDSQGKIESLIKKITKIFEEIKIGVIDTLALRYQKTNNKIIETFNAIKAENEQNSLSYSSNSLFGGKDNTKTIIELLKKLIDLIEFEKSSQIDIEDSFILEFRVVENGNDSRYVPSLDMVGSNGTDVLVKSMIYVAMLHIFKQKLTKKELSFQVVLDEVGILSQRYLKELIEFANKKGIVFVNGAPDEKLIGTYKQVSLISKVDKISVVKELIIK